uniref:Uncharacterized protein n=1 Tax=Arundo donax TaxID=35708 RepID=A0A0A9HML6_ARUDO
MSHEFMELSATETRYGCTIVDLPAVLETNSLSMSSEPSSSSSP